LFVDYVIRLGAKHNYLVIATLSFEICLTTWWIFSFNFKRYPFFEMRMLRPWSYFKFLQ